MTDAHALFLAAFLRTFDVSKMIATADCYCSKSKINECQSGVIGIEFLMELPGYIQPGFVE